MAGATVKNALTAIWLILRCLSNPVTGGGGDGDGPGGDGDGDGTGGGGDSTGTVRVIDGVEYDEIQVTETFVESRAMKLSFPVEDCALMLTNTTETSTARTAIVVQVVAFTPLTVSDIAAVLLECVEQKVDGLRRVRATSGETELEATLMLANTTDGVALNNSVAALNEAIAGG